MIRLYLGVMGYKFWKGYRLDDAGGEIAEYCRNYGTKEPRNYNILIMKKSVWMSYDLGVQGDYNHLYAWLDNHNAVECGDSMVYFVYEVPDETDDDTFKTILREDLESSIKFNPGNRIYMVRRVKDDKKDAYYGQFIIGKRKASPWEGYGDKAENNDDGAQ